MLDKSTKTIWNAGPRLQTNNLYIYRIVNKNFWECWTGEGNVKNLKLMLSQRGQSKCQMKTCQKTWPRNGIRLIHTSTLHFTNLLISQMFEHSFYENIAILTIYSKLGTYIVKIAKVKNEETFITRKMFLCKELNLLFRDLEHLLSNMLCRNPSIAI